MLSRSQRFWIDVYGLGNCPYFSRTVWKKNGVNEVNNPNSSLRHWITVWDPLDVFSSSNMAPLLNVTDHTLHHRQKHKWFLLSVRTSVRQSRAFWRSLGREGAARGKKVMLTSSILSRKVGHTESGRSLTLDGLEGKVKHWVIWNVS